MSKIKNNEITHTGNSGTSNIVMDASGNVTTAGDLTVTGNDIKSSGATAITMSGANVTVAGTCTATGGFVGVASTCARNYITNGDMQIAQRGTSVTAATAVYTNNDDTYCLDRWNLLSDGNDIVDITQNSEVPATGATKSIGLDVETANKKFGILQVIESVDCKSIIGGTASLSFKMKASAVDQWGANSVKAAIISWSSTADSVTSDVVNAWGAEGTRPTLATYWTYENANDSGTTGNFTPTTSWATYTLKNVSIDTSSTANVAVFIWSDVTGTTAGQFLYITDVQLEAGSDTTDYLRQRYTDEFLRCSRYYWRASSLSANKGIGSAAYKSSSDVRCVVPFPTEMRVPPTIVSNDTSNSWYVMTGSQDFLDDWVLAFASEQVAVIKNATDAGGTLGQAGYAATETTAASLGFLAEL